MKRLASFGLSAAALLLMAACTAIHPPAVTQRSGVVPGDSITVKENQNAYAFAQDHGVSMRDIITLNGLQPPYQLRAGQSVILPFKRGEAGPDIGVSSVPLDSGVSSVPLTSGSSSGGFSSSSLSSGVETQSLPPIASQPLAPPATPPAPTAKTAVAALNAPAIPPVKPVTTTASQSAVASAPAAAETADAPSMIWPVQGPILSEFGPKGQGVSNDGVNIGAPKGSPVVAAAGGTVVYAGNDMKGFGNLILIRHEGGWVTAYAHLDRVLVGKDSVVAQGDEIGTVGKTGNIASPQLHFEVRQGDKPVDPKNLVKN